MIKLLESRSAKFAQQLHCKRWEDTDGKVIDPGLSNAEIALSYLWGGGIKEIPSF